VSVWQFLFWGLFGLRTRGLHGPGGPRAGPGLVFATEKTSRAAGITGRVGPSSQIISRKRSTYLKIRVTPRSVGKLCSVLNLDWSITVPELVFDQSKSKNVLNSSPVKRDISLFYDAVQSSCKTAKPIHVYFVLQLVATLIYGPLNQ
jgi:hypothetical protein